MQLIIVESPSKAKTIEKYLGGKYKVDASGGHVRDLPEKRLGVNVAKNYQPNYVVPADKKAVIKDLKKRWKKRIKSTSRPTRTVRERLSRGTFRSPLIYPRTRYAASRSTK